MSVTSLINYLPHASHLKHGYDVILFDPLRGIPSLNISVEDTVLGAGFWECPSLELALLGEEVMSDLSCPPFVRLRVQGVGISLRSQRCAFSSVGLRRLITAISKLWITSGSGGVVSPARPVKTGQSALVLRHIFQSSLTSSEQRTLSRTRQWLPRHAFRGRGMCTIIWR